MQKGDTMEKFIPYEKLSKKKQRELNASRRTTWALNPVTRKPANPKAYNRKTARKWKDDSNSVSFVFCFCVAKRAAIRPPTPRANRRSTPSMPRQRKRPSPCWSR